MFNMYILYIVFLKNYGNICKNLRPYMGLYDNDDNTNDMIISYMIILTFLSGYTNLSPYKKALYRGIFNNYNQLEILFQIFQLSFINRFKCHFVSY